MLKILDGKIIRDETIIKLKNEVESFSIKPVLAIIQVGDLEESNKYIKSKKVFGEKIGAEIRHVKLADNISEVDLISEIQKLNNDEKVWGIITQLPLPSALKEKQSKIIEEIDPKKDVDGLTSQSKFTPATARGILNLLDYYKIDVNEKKVVVMGRSNLVGRPTAKALVARGAKVTVVHSQTENPKEITKAADILIVAIGKASLVDETYVSPEQIVIDVGINMQDGKLVGDVNFEKVKDIVLAITPVPGGIGPLTVASLFENLVETHRDMV